MDTMINRDLAHSGRMNETNYEKTWELSDSLTVNRVYFGMAETKRSSIYSRRDLFPKQSERISDESTRWQTTHNRRHGAPRPAELYKFCWGLVGLEVADVSVGPTGTCFLRAVLKFVAAIKIKLGLDPTRGAITNLSWSQFFSEAATDDIFRSLVEKERE